MYVYMCVCKCMCVDDQYTYNLSKYLKKDGR